MQIPEQGIDPISPLIDYLQDGAPLDTSIIMELVRDGRAIIQQIGNAGLKLTTPDAFQRYRSLCQFVTRETDTEDFFPFDPSKDSEGLENGYKESVHQISGVHTSRRVNNPHRTRSIRRLE